LKFGLGVVGVGRVIINVGVNRWERRNSRYLIDLVEGVEVP
jgi:hypothetical protein